MSHRDASRTLEIAFAALEAANRAPVFQIRIPDENLSGIRIGDIDIVLGIDGHALWRYKRIFPALARQKFVLLFFEIEDVNAGKSGICDDDASARVGYNAIGPHHLVEVRRPCDDIDNPVPEAALQLHFSFGRKAAFVRQLPSVQRERWNLYLLSDRLLRIFGTADRGTNREGCEYGDPSIGHTVATWFKRSQSAWKLPRTRYQGLRVALLRRRNPVSNGCIRH